MNTFLKISVIAVSAALIGVSAQAQTASDNASNEVYGPAAPAAVSVASTKALPVYNTGLTRAEVRDEQARAWAAGELDYAQAEINGVMPQRGSVEAGKLRMAARK